MPHHRRLQSGAQTRFHRCGTETTVSGELHLFEQRMRGDEGEAVDGRWGKTELMWEDVQTRQTEHL